MPMKQAKVIQLFGLTGDSMTRML